MDMPDECRAIAQYARTEAVRFALDPNVRGFGLGLREVGGEETGEFALVVFVEEKLASRRVAPERMLPRTVVAEGHEVHVDVQRAPADVIRTTRLACPPFPRRSGGCAGSSISVQGGDPCGGGTLTGTWSSLGGGGRRGMTCCHVALDFGIEEFLAGLPGSLAWLLRSPSGRRIVASAGLDVGQDQFRLMRIDTPWPILVPWPTPLVIAGALAFIYVDAAAGRVRPEPLPVPPPLPPPAPISGMPPLRGAVGGGRLRDATAPIPGTPVTKTGRTTGTTWGRVLVSFLQIPIPVPGPVPIVILFDQILCRLSIAPGDSGAPLTTLDLEFLGCCWGGLPFSVRTQRLAPPGCPTTDQDVIPTTLATPWWWLSVLMDLDLT